MQFFHSHRSNNPPWWHHFTQFALKTEILKFRMRFGCFCFICMQNVIQCRGITWMKEPSSADTFPVLSVCCWSGCNAKNVHHSKNKFSVDRKIHIFETWINNEDERTSFSTVVAPELLTMVNIARGFLWNGGIYVCWCCSFLRWCQCSMRWKKAIEKNDDKKARRSERKSKKKLPF